MLRRSGDFKPTVITVGDLSLIAVGRRLRGGRTSGSAAGFQVRCF
jgi:hypothetical protein